jgi:hypothetical protein
VPVVGAGVSKGVARFPDWSGLIANGLEYAATVNEAQPDFAEEIRKHLAANNFARAAELLKSAVRAPSAEFSAWLNTVFRLSDESYLARSLVDRICDLMAPLIATTNYDRLITTLHPERWEPVTWTDPVGMQTALHLGNRVLHLHGVYDQPRSVVFGIDNYDELVADPAYEAVIRGLWLQRTLLFIGCSFSGLEDPDFSQLLTWATRTFRGSPYKHYALTNAYRQLYTGSTGSLSP